MQAVPCCAKALKYVTLCPDLGKHMDERRRTSIFGNIPYYMYIYIYILYNYNYIARRREAHLIMRPFMLFYKWIINWLLSRKTTQRVKPQLAVANLGPLHARNGAVPQGSRPVKKEVLLQSYGKMHRMCQCKHGVILKLQVGGCPINQGQTPVCPAQTLHYTAVLGTIKDTTLNNGPVRHRLTWL